MLIAQPISLLVIGLVVLLYVTAEPQQHQCTDTDPSKPRSFIRDSPLHEALVADTGKALDKFVDSSGRYRYRPRYFEGWYYKIDLPSDGGTFVVIPGLYLRKEEQYGFVMILDATKGQGQGQGTDDHDHPICRFYKFPMEGISSEVDGDHDFVFRLDDQNVFTAHGFTLNLPADNDTDNDTDTDMVGDNHSQNPAIVGNAEWISPLPLPGNRWSPTIMGWFSWLPRGTMQCSHGVVSMDHSIGDGIVRIGNSKVIRLAGAQGYIEKDWGREFPEKYTWIQANDFSISNANSNANGNDSESDDSPTPGASFLVSVASIPVKPFESWLHFTGFLSFLRFPDMNGIFHTVRFATYTGAKVSYTYNITHNNLLDDDDSKPKPREHTVIVKMTSLQYSLTATVTGDRDGAGTLWGPLPSNPSGGMRPYVREMLNCPVHVVLTRRSDGMVLFDGKAQHGGFEIEGHDEDEKATTTTSM